MKKQQLTLLLIATMLTSGQSLANTKDKNPPSEDISIYGTDCEQIKGDFKSSVRVRAADKATFLAVSTIPDLVDFRKNMSDHDFNVMVYSIVDDMIDNMTVKTLKQNEEELCVEITGTVNSDNIYKAVGDYIESKEKESIIGLAPEEEKVVEIEVENDTPDTIITTTTTTTVIEKVAPQEIKSLVYVPPLTFYNNTRSSQYAQVIKNMFVNNPHLGLTNNPDDADYIIRSKVLRAKVDQINDQNSRLQMIVSVELEITRDKARLTENQNRFVLFSKTDNEQEVAANLMRSLLEKAGQSVFARVEKDAEHHQKSDPTNTAIITPPSGTIRVVKE